MSGKKRALIILCMVNAVDMTGFGIVLPLLPFYAESFGASALEITLISASFTGMQLLMSPLLGRLSDRFGRRPILIMGLFASAVSYTVFGAANGLWLLVLARMAGGAAAGTVAVAQAYVADITEGRDRAAALGHLGAASGVGLAIGPIIGGYFSTFGLGAPGFIAAALCVVNGLAALTGLPETNPSPAGDQPARARRPLAEVRQAIARFPVYLLFAVYFIGISTFYGNMAVLALLLQDTININADGMGLLWMWVGIVTIAARGLLVGPMSRRFGEAGAVLAGLVALLVVMLTVPIAPNLVTAFASMTLYALGAGLLFPALASLTSRAVGKQIQGSVLGANQLVGGIGKVLGPILAGWAFQYVTIGTPFFASAMLLAVAGCLIWTVRQPVSAPPLGPKSMTSGM